MVKNAIITIQFIMLMCLAIQKPSNVDLIVNDVKKTTEAVDMGVDYVKKTFVKEFDVIEDVKDFSKEAEGKLKNEMEKAFHSEEEQK